MSFERELWQIWTASASTFGSRPLKPVVARCSPLPTRLSCIWRCAGRLGGPPERRQAGGKRSSEMAVDHHHHGFGGCADHADG